MYGGAGVVDGRRILYVESVFQYYTCRGVKGGERRRGRGVMVEVVMEGGRGEWVKVEVVMEGGESGLW